MWFINTGEITFSRCHSEAQAEFNLEGKHFIFKDLRDMEIVFWQERMTSQNYLNKYLHIYIYICIYIDIDINIDIYLTTH